MSNAATEQPYENGTIGELRGTGWGLVRLVPQGQTHKGAGALVSVPNLLTDWDQLSERAGRAEAENAQLRATVAALTAALAG